MTDRKSEIASRILQGEPVETAIYAGALGGLTHKQSPMIAAAAALDLTEAALRFLQERATQKRDAA